MTICATDNRITRRVPEGMGQGKSVSFFRPDVDVFETNDEFRIIADVPGASADSIELDFDGDTLTLTARVPERMPTSGVRHLLAEHQVGDYRRAFRFDQSVNKDAAAAEFRDGVLTVTVPKSESARARKVPIKTG